MHGLRKKIDELIFEVEQTVTNDQTKPNEGRALALVRTKLQEAKMWAGKVLEAQKSPLPKEYRDHCEAREE